MLVADTSVLYALADEEDAHHAQAMREAGRQRSVLVPSEILAETLAMIGFRLGKDAARAWLSAFRQIPHARVAATRQAIVDDACASLARPGSLSYPDWILVHTCRSVGAQPWTFDADVRRAVKA